MRLTGITATAHPAGNRIDLRWANPDPAGLPAVRVVRGDGAYPRRPGDGTLVAAAAGLTATDTGLPGERPCFYALFPFKGTVPDAPPEPGNLVSAVPVEPYGFGARMYGLLPAVHRRHDTGHEWLRRFLELPGGELDRLYSEASAALELADPAAADERTLDLLARWIGWRTGHTLPLDARRAELRAAPHLYRGTGSLPAVRSTVARVTSAGGTGVVWPARVKELLHGVARTNRPERLNLWSRVRAPGGQWSAALLASRNQAYGGRAAAVTEADGSVRIFYHVLRARGTEIWAKRWNAGTWEPSAPVIAGTGEDRHPAAAAQGNRLWLFWQRRDPATGRSGLWSSIRTGTSWSAPAPPFPAGDADRSRPAAVADGTGGVWLFWLEGGAIRFRRHDGTAWSAPGSVTPAAVPADDDLYVVIRPGAPRLWLLWAGRPAGGFWSVAWAVKQGLDPAAADWSVPGGLAKPAQEAHDRHPAAIAAANGIELFWSTTRQGAWSIDSAGLAGAPPVAGAAVQVAGGAYTRRAPLPVALPGGSVLLVDRSNEDDRDGRGAGTTTVDTRAKAKLALSGTFEDFQTYTHGRLAVRDAVGLFASPPGGLADEEVEDVKATLRDALAEVLPLACRPLIIT